MNHVLGHQLGLYSNDLGVHPDAAPPRPGQAHLTPVKDDETGIHFELQRMQAAVRACVHDPAFISVVRDVMLSISGYENDPHYKLAQVAAWHEWVKANFQYVNDPISIVCDGRGCNQTATEVIQTPQRMGRRIREPGEMVKGILAPLQGRALETQAGRTFQVPENILAKAVGDCDEGAVLDAGGPACLGIESAFRLGGHMDRQTGEPSYHHVWAVALVGDQWIDMDATVKEFKLGQFAPFPVYGKVYIFRGDE